MIEADLDVHDEPEQALGRAWQSRPLAEEWRVFARVLFGPWVVLTAVLAIALLIAPVIGALKGDGAVIITVLNLLFGVFAGVLGGILATRWGKVTEEQLIVALGKQAIQNLLTLAKTIAALESRVTEYLHAIKGADDRDAAAEFRLVQVYLEEVTRDCQTLGDVTKNAINTWREVIPEVAVEDQVGQYREYQLEKASRIHRIADLEALMEESRLDAQEVAKLRSELDQAVSEVVRLRREQLERDPFRVGRVGSTIGTSSMTYTPLLAKQMKFIDHISESYQDVKIRAIQEQDRIVQRAMEPFRQSARVEMDDEEARAKLEKKK